MGDVTLLVYVLVFHMVWLVVIVQYSVVVFVVVTVTVLALAT
jgi:hypothetical protein